MVQGARCGLFRHAGRSWHGIDDGADGQPVDGAQTPGMEALLLVLVLFSDPAAQPTANLLAEELAQRGGGQVQVVVGADALKRLEAKGLRDGDLIATPQLVDQLCAHDPRLVIVRLEHRAVSGDQVVESRIWSSGRSDRHTAIAGKGGDPAASAVSGIVEVLAPRLSSMAPGTAGDARSIGLPGMVQRQAWREMRDLLVPLQDKSARDFYYLILAQVHLRDAAAKETLAAMAKAYPGHFMLKAAENLLPGEAEAPVNETKLDH